MPRVKPTLRSRCSHVAGSGETETVRRIVAELEQMDPEQRRFLAGFAYILARAAHSDLSIGGDEQSLMEQIVTDIGGLTESQAVLVVQIAKHQTELYGGTEDFLVTREFEARATDEQKRQRGRGLLRRRRRGPPDNGRGIRGDDPDRRRARPNA